MRLWDLPPHLTLPPHFFGAPRSIQDRLRMLRTSFRDRRAIPIAASGCAAPSAAVVLGPVVKESPTVLIGALLYTGKISTAEQSSRGLSDRNKKLLRFIQIQFEPPFKTVWGLNHLRDSRRPPDQTVNDSNTGGRNRPSSHNRLSHPAQHLAKRESILVNALARCPDFPFFRSLLQFGWLEQRGRSEPRHKIFEAAKQIHALPRFFS